MPRFWKRRGVNQAAVKMTFLEELNDEQSTAATAAVNAAVSAGAGAGKTRVLAARYCWLIMEGKCGVEEILSITFTNKAANEMYSRIYRLLSENSANQAARRAVEHFHRASISTLDSFCASVARTASRRFGISPDFSSDMGRVRETAQKLALRFVLDNRNNPGLKELIAEKKMRGVADELFADPALYYGTISSPMDFPEGNRLQKEKLLADWDVKTREAAVLVSALGDEAAGMQNAEFAKIISGVLDKEAAAPSLDALFRGGKSAEGEAYFSFLSGICSINLQGRRNPLVKEYRDRLKNGLAAELALIANYAAQWEIVESVRPLMEEFQELFNRKKRETGCLTFADIARLAVDALGDDLELRQMYKNTFKQIMIDEFQDNNMLQRDLVFLLAEKIERREKGIPKKEDLEPGKVFFVGDEKQSIYGFRGADVSVFRGLVDDFSGGDKSLRLSRNYRSNPALIKAFNRIFGGLRFENDSPPAPGIFPPKEKAALWEASYSWMKSGDEADKNGDDDPALYFAFLDKDKVNGEDPLGCEDLEAVYIAGKIRSLIDKGIKIFDKNTGLRRPLEYRDIAVLQRSYGHQRRLEKFFKMFNIPFNAERPADLFGDAPVNDLTALLKLLVYPFDRIAYGTLLRSPLVRLSDTAFSICMLNDDKNGEPFNEDVEKLIPEEECEAYRRGRRLYRDLLGAAENSSLPELVTRLWYHEGYRYEALWSSQSQVFLGLYDLFFERARHIEDQGKGLPEFIDYLESLINKEENIDESDIPPEGGGGVSLMSIHKCKGLEFPVVFIFNCGRTERAHPQTALAAFSPRRGLSLKLPASAEFQVKSQNYFELLEKDEDEQKRQAELRRLLYVAMTRAECMLFLTASFSKSADTENLKPNSFLNLLLPVLAETDDPVFTVESIYPYTQAELQDAVKFVSRTALENGTGRAGNGTMKNAAALALPLYAGIPRAESGPWLPPAIPASGLSVSVQSKDGAAAAAVSAQEISARPVFDEELDLLLEKEGVKNEDFGTLVHRFIEDRFNERPVRAAGALDKKALELAERFFDSSLGKKSLSAAFRETEFSVLTAVDGSLVSGKIDLLFEEEGTIHIVDFKTDKVEDPAKHAGQLALYRRAVSGIYEKPLCCWIFFLRGGRALEMDGELSAVNLEELVSAWKLRYT